MKYASPGSISHATLRTEDLLSAFANALEGLILLNVDWLSQPEHFNTRDRYNRIHGEAVDCFDDGGLDPAKEDDANELVNEDLFYALNDFAPPYFYFGSHPGDGADFGFWLSDEWREQAEDDDALFVDDTADVPSDYSGEVFHVSDHGNVTLYTADNGELSEVWSIV